MGFWACEVGFWASLRAAVLAVLAGAVGSLMAPRAVRPAGSMRLAAAGSGER